MKGFALLLLLASVSAIPLSGDDNTTQIRQSIDGQNITFIDLISSGRDKILQYNPNAQLYSVKATPESTENFAPWKKLTNVQFKAVDNITGDSIYMTVTSANGSGPIITTGPELNIGLPLPWPITKDVSTAVQPILTLSNGVFSEAYLKQLAYPSGPSNVLETVWQFNLGKSWCQVGVFDSFVSCVG